MYSVTFHHWFNILCLCFVHSCVSSSTSSRRKSDGWGSSWTRGTYASNSWSWRLRTSKTPRVHFKTGPTHRVTFTSSRNTCITVQTPFSSLGSWLTCYPFKEPPILTAQGRFKPQRCVFLSVCQFHTRCTYSLFMYIHSNTESYPAVTHFKTLLHLLNFTPVLLYASQLCKLIVIFSFFFNALCSGEIKGCFCLSWLNDVAVCVLFESCCRAGADIPCDCTIMLNLFSMLGDCFFPPPIFKLL